MNKKDISYAAINSFVFWLIIPSRWDCDRLERSTAIESVITNLSYTRRNDYRRKRGTAFESVISNLCYTWRNCDRWERKTQFESTNADRLERIRERNLLQKTATEKCRVADAFDRVRDLDGFNISPFECARTYTNNSKWDRNVLRRTFADANNGFPSRIELRMGNEAASAPSAREFIECKADRRYSIQFNSNVYKSTFCYIRSAELLSSFIQPVGLLSKQENDITRPGFRCLVMTFLVLFLQFLCWNMSFT